jgi:hypothetical protein
MPGRLESALDSAHAHLKGTLQILEEARNLESTDVNRRDLSIAITSLEDAELRILRIKARLS